ncbi:hypothetical protein MMAGJ_52260 [Mycolicibacterium mageritense]|uniref:Uncharacterized protein n=1 Tax=Mycolicibacterium mageritense TaxID=53462 RepID=A0ABN5YFG9_MYCME|nr:hypothetical protein MMAGJ_52260 [Mycolicibacterium mageritense]
MPTQAGSSTKTSAAHRFPVDTLVVDPGAHRDRTGGGHHLTFVVIPVAHHQPVPILIDLIDELVDIGGDLSAQCRGEHLPGPVTHDLIEDRAVLAGRVGTFVVVDYREHEGVCCTIR